MKKRTEKQPVDDLFARKLENMSLPPSPDGFTRLQARMGQGQPEARLVFWRNPDIQRYMALAACLLLVCLFGWYQSNDTVESGQQNTVALNKQPVSSEQKRVNDAAVNKSAGDIATIQPIQEQKVEKQIDAESTTSRPFAEPNQLAFDQPAKASSQVIRKGQPARTVNKVDQNPPATVLEKPVEQLAKADTKSPSAESTIEKQKVESAVANATTKPAPAAERVLVVTIAEPEALVAARQAVKTQSQLDDKTVATGTNNSEKEAKPTTLWQQMKRLKQGEVFARKDAGEDERGLIGRAYSGIKQTLDKEKSVKQ